MTPKNHNDNSSKISLKEYVNIRFDELQKSLDKSDKALTERLSGMNEIREAMREQSNLFATRKEIELLLDPIKKDIKELLLSKATLEGKASQTAVVGVYVLAVLGLIISLIGCFKIFG